MTAAGTQKDESGLMVLHVKWTEDRENDGYYYFSDQYDKPSVDLVNTIMTDFSETNHDISWEWVQFQENMPKSSDFNEDLVFGWFGINIFHEGKAPPHESLSCPMLLTVTWRNRLFNDKTHQYVIETYGQWKYVQHSLRTIFEEMKKDGHVSSWKWEGLEPDHGKESTSNFHSDMVSHYFDLDLVVPGTEPVKPVEQPDGPNLSKFIANFEASCERMKELGIDDEMSEFDQDMLKMMKNL